MKKSIIISYIGSAMLACLFFSSCSMVSDSEKNRVAPIAETVDDNYFTAVDVARGDVVATDKYSALFRKSNGVSLSFSTNNAKITESYVKVGDKVKVGDLLLECNSADLTANYESLVSSEATYQAEIDYYTELIDIEESRKTVYASYGETYVSEKLKEYSELLDLAKKNLNITKQQLKEAEEALAGCKLYSPIEGTVSFVAKTNDRDRLNAGDTAVSVSDGMAYFICTTKKRDQFTIDSVYDLEYFYMEEKSGRRGRKQEENPVETAETEGTVDNRLHTEVVCKAIDVANESSGTYNVTLVPVDQSKIDTSRNVSAFITIELDSAENVLYIPKKALIKSADGYVVYVQEDNGNRSLKNVEVGIIASDTAEIKSGLELGETVLTNNAVNK